jgi:hypothetical protein
MELINKTHDRITSNQRIKLAAYFKIRDSKSVYFSAGAVLKYGLFPGLYVHFQNDGELWYFYTNKENDGFRLLKRDNKNAAIICDASLVNLLYERVKCSTAEKYLIKLTAAKLSGNHILEIDFKNPIQLDPRVKLKKEI